MESSTCARSAIRSDGKEANIREEQIDYVVGSGNHARTYLRQTLQGRLVELPINWYMWTKGGFWNMSPGFDRHDQPDLHGAVSGECIFCHTAYPLSDDRKTRDDEQVFPATLPEGIDCQVLLPRTGSDSTYRSGEGQGQS